MAITNSGHAKFSYATGPNAISLGSSVSPGDIIAGYLYLDNAPTTPSLVDSLGNSYTFDTPMYMPTADIYWYPFYTIVTNAGTPTLTADVPDHSGIRGAFVSATGFTGTPSLLLSSDTTNTSNTITFSLTAPADAFLTAIIANEDFYNKNAASPWTIPDNSTGALADTACRVVTAGAQSGNIATMGASSKWYAHTFVFGVAGGGGGGPTLTPPNTNGVVWPMPNRVPVTNYSGMIFPRLRITNR